MMRAVYKENLLTPVSFEQATDAMRSALQSEMGTAPSVEVLALALAKTALETGRWRLMHCWNFGNIKAGEEYVGMFTCFGCGENLADGEWWFEPNGREKHGGLWRQLVVYDPPTDGGHPQTRFRAYANRFDGAYEYVAFIARGSRYKACWQALLSGDPHQYVLALKAAKYFTAPAAPYLAAVTSLWSQYRRLLQGIPVIEPEVDDGLPSWAELRAQVVSRQFEEENFIQRIS